MLITVIGLTFNYRVDISLMSRVPFMLIEQEKCFWDTFDFRETFRQHIESEPVIVCKNLYNFLP